MNFTTPPDHTSISGALASIFGDNVTITRRDRVSGGDINDAYRLTLSNGEIIFIKTNTKNRAAMFSAESAGLAAMRQTGAVGVPRVLCTGTDNEGAGCSFLMMEFIEGNPPIAEYWETLGHELAAMHRAETADFVAKGKYGFSYDNFIGSSEQKNPDYDCWIDFFRDCRLLPQINRAKNYFDTAHLKKFDWLLGHLEKFLVEPDKPSLLHGDLWSGNVIRGNNGKAWLIDPAAYVGHAEADLAMTELFGGFQRAFYHAYQEDMGLLPDYDERRDLYNLYHMLNHLNLFGRSYLSSVKRIVEKYA